MSNKSTDDREIGVDLRLQAVDGVSMVVGEGNCASCSGPTARTTLMDLVRQRPSPLRAASSSRTPRSPTAREHRDRRAGIGRKFRSPASFRGLTVLQSRGWRLPHPGVFANLGFGFSAEDRDRVDGALRLAGLRSGRPALGGEPRSDQWLELAMLIQNTGIILLPAGMTRRDAEPHWIIGLRGATLVVVEHDMALRPRIAEEDHRPPPRGPRRAASRHRAQRRSAGPISDRRGSPDAEAQRCRPSLRPQPRLLRLLARTTASWRCSAATASARPRR